VHARQSLSGFALSPDGQQLVLVQVRDRRAVEDRQRKRVRETPLADLCLLPTGGGYPRPFTSTGDVAQLAAWSPDGSRLLLQRGGVLCSVPLDGGAPQTVFRGALYRSRLGPGDAHLGGPRWSPGEGSWVLLATRMAPETTLLLVSADGSTQRRLLTVEGTLVCWDWSPDGRWAAVVVQGEDTSVVDLRLVDVARGEARVLWREPDSAYLKPVAAWSPATAGGGGARLVFRSNRSGWAKLWTATFQDAGGDGGPESQERQERQAEPGFEVQPLTTGEWDDYAFRCSPDGQGVVFASRAEQDGSGDDLWTVPLSGGPPTRLTHQGGVNVPYGWAPDGTVVYWHSSPTEPGDLWAISTEPSGNEAVGRGRRLTWSAPAELERKLRPPEEVILTGSEGQRVHALVYLPVDHQEGQRYPPIVWVRGGPTGFSRFDYAPQLSWLANEGFLVLTPNYRGSTGHGVAFMEAVAGEGLGQNDLADVLAGAEYARGHPCADPQRGVGIGGRSWGGYLTLMAVTRAPEVFSCAVAGAAISDWMVQQAQTETRAYDRWLVGGWLYEQEARARDRSPVTHAGRIKAPLLVFHGEADLNVPFAQIGPFVERARQAGAAVEFVTYPLEGHGNLLPQNQQDALEKTRAFFRRHLQPWNFRDNPTGGQVP
jgi:dipeptidyl aminopeptidase/acylaminoacyl peptidase